jgi:hypothetical protein
VERVGNIERRIVFEVGYDHRAFPDECGGGGHGQHGMNMRWVLIGPKGAVQWLVYMTNWVPGNVRHGEVGAEHPVSIVPVNRVIGDGMAADIGYHSPVPLWEGQEEYGHMKCELLPEGECYYDGSGVNAEPLLEAFLAHGPHAVWAALARYYGSTFEGRDAAVSPDEEQHETAPLWPQAAQKGTPQ